MSNGKMCGCKIKISTEINGTNTIEIECDNYEGHEGNHSKMFYHCVDRPNDKIFKDNHRLGKIEWKTELVEKQEKLAEIERWVKNGAFIDKPRSTI